MSVSVITPVHGRQEDYWRIIEDVGQGLATQTLKPHQWIIVCDTNSSWVKELSLPDFTKILTSPQNNISMKRNLALDEAKGEFILFLDSDQTPATPELISECVAKAHGGFDILLIPERFSYRGGYLKRCYHHLRGLYWKHSGEGIPRFFRRSTIGNIRYDVHHLHFEDWDFYESARTGAREGVITKQIVHDEAFKLYGNLRKVRIAQKQKSAHEIRASFRLGPRQILGETPITMLPGVLLILLLRTLAKRLLPIKGDTSR